MYVLCILVRVLAYVLVDLDLFDPYILSISLFIIPGYYILVGHVRPSSHSHYSYDRVVYNITDIALNNLIQSPRHHCVFHETGSRI